MAGEQRRARVVLMTEGSRGDHQPYIALARTLQRDFDVTLVVNDGFQEMAREYGYAHFLTSTRHRCDAHAVRCGSPMHGC